ncbi:MAG TPA: DUF309 domain-containing protein [Gemmataceae bacterium]|nr:DUF309 domain-containing protein [Gemmataceae bacterium]
MTDDPRYLAGVLLFNEQEFFEAHEVWEDLWAESHGDTRRFYQGLIQAAVGLCHFANGNVRGAVKLFRTSHGYMEGLPTPFQGMDLTGFWRGMDACFGPLLTHAEGQPMPELTNDMLPTIVLDPPPAIWPDPAMFVKPEH